MKAFLNNGVILWIMILFIGCSFSNYPEYDNVFSFEYEGENYQILGRNTEYGRGSNLLIQRKGETIQLRAHDYNQDGSIDEILKGGLSLDEANEIYREGIIKALEKGSLDQQLYTRTYELEENEITYIIQTLENSDGTFLNRFLIYDTKEGEDSILLDTNVDGSLDQVYKGEGKVEDYQEEYTRVLQQGIEEGKIIEEDGAYLVEKNDAVV